MSEKCSKCGRPVQKKSNMAGDYEMIETICEKDGFLYGTVKMESLTIEQQTELFQAIVEEFGPPDEEMKIND